MFLLEVFTAWLWSITDATNISDKLAAFIFSVELKNKAAAGSSETLLNV
jgi:hypothetical protein